MRSPGRRRRFNLYTVTLLGFLVTSFPQPSMAQEVSGMGAPFFLVGDGHIKITNSHNGRSVDVIFMTSNGQLIDSAFDKIDFVFGFPTKEKGENISRRTIAMLDYFSDLVGPGKVISLASGYRSEAYNQRLRNQGKTAAKTSTHLDGMAIDFLIPGVDGKNLWDLVRAKDCCGVGNYGGNVIHLDSGRPRFWEKATAKVHTGASDFNRYIYLSTEYDRYRASEEVRLLFTSISDFGFGIKPEITIVSDKKGTEKIAKTGINSAGDKNCIMIQTRRDARFIYTTLPANLDNKRVRLRIDFCNKPFAEMPDQTVSNEIEID